MIMMGNC